MSQMKEASLKLELIERLMKLQNTSTLKRLDQLITQAEMEDRAERSLENIEKDEVLSLEEFKKENLKWMKRKNSK